MSARDDVLARIRLALRDEPEQVTVPREYRTVGDLAPGSSEALEMLVDRLEDYRATVIRADGPDDDAIGVAIAGALGGLDLAEGATVLRAPGVPQEWAGSAEADDGTRGPRDLDAVAAVVTGSVVAIAETGTIVLDGSPLSGRRALTLVPDVHVCVVRAGDVVQSVPEGLGRLDPLRPLTFISGPSATSDIELIRVEGVHGPRTLIVILTPP
ncbi:lactate utilization protein C [Janibacter sp. GXQ6167]|uniref:LutC/YkgG family protein n=1 Tax=Janibacter sp. GXQ6167 TaxID=3240791 RepID=UPI003525A20F